jgi:hypothetical protein
MIFAGLAPSGQKMTQKSSLDACAKLSVCLVPVLPAPLLLRMAVGLKKVLRRASIVTHAFYGDFLVIFTMTMYNDFKGYILFSKRSLDVSKYIHTDLKKQQKTLNF